MNLIGKLGGKGPRGSGTLGLNVGLGEGRPLAVVGVLLGGATWDRGIWEGVYFSRFVVLVGGILRVKGPIVHMDSRIGARFRVLL